MSISANYPNVKPALLLDFANAQTLDSRVTFTRSTTAVYYDNHSATLAEQNLVLQSQNIGGTSWNLNTTTVVTNSVIAPDGTTTASALTANGASGTHTVNPQVQASNSNPQTLSVYAQAGTNNFIQLLYGTDINAYANFNLSTGSLGTVGSSATATITQVGSTTWYRCTISTTSATAAGFLILICTSGTAARNEINTLNTSVNLWGAQLEQRSSVTAYNATTTSAITNYIPTLQTAPINAPRFDFNPVTGESLGLLIEQSSTNLLTYSQDFTNAIWTKPNATITTAANIAPDGTQTAQKLVATAVSGEHYVLRNYGVSAQYTASIYAKAAEYSRLILGTGQGQFFVGFNLTTGTVESTVGTGLSNPTITSVGNGWYKCSVVIASNQNFYAATFNAAYTSGSVNPVFTGDGYSGIYIWGAQLEALAFPTSYIATTSSQVTRAADVASMTGTNFSSWFDIQQGTFFADVIPISSTLANSGVVSLTPVSAGSYLQMSASGWGSTNGWYSNGLTSLGTAQSQNKTAITYGLAFKSFAGVMNGGSYVSSTASDYAGTSTGMVIGSANSNYCNARIRKIAYYPQSFSSSQLQALTGS